MMRHFSSMSYSSHNSMLQSSSSIRRRIQRNNISSSSSSSTRFFYFLTSNYLFLLHRRALPVAAAAAFLSTKSSSSNSFGTIPNRPSLLVQSQPLSTTTTTCSLNRKHRTTMSTATATQQFSTTVSSSSGEETTTTAKGTAAGVLDSIAERFENSWIQQLSPETPENLAKSLTEEGIKKDPSEIDNKFRRPVFNGHYVFVEPTGIKNPELILYSPNVAHELLGLTKEQTSSEEFIDWVSGNLVLGEKTSWATPYALSIMGTRYTSNCPYGTGNGYGDGRAISIGEFNGYELQLKGSGKTPFCRGADGRAILRSSVREFLASEAMYALGVATTRALSLVASKRETVNRPWYNEGTKLQLPSRDDPRLAKYTEEQKKELESQLREANRGDPNIMQAEPVAITCRVSPSFTRIGHLDLFARRVDKQYKDRGSSYDTTSIEWNELQQIIWHACYREFRDGAYTPFIESKDIQSAAKVLLEESAKAITTMVANWIRVGYVQGNFNADNCLVGGHTMDYGPFGYVDEYNPIAAKWTGSGEHFGFLNQPSAGLMNYKILLESIVPVLLVDDETNPTGTNTKVKRDELIDTFMEQAANAMETAVNGTFRAKLGFLKTDDRYDTLWKQVEPLLRTSRTDWTIFFRSLTYIVRDFLSKKADATDDPFLNQQILAALEGTYVGATENDYPGTFYEPLTDKQRTEWMEWIDVWRKALIESDRTTDEIYNDMILTNPKYILREWMLVQAYQRAQPPYWENDEIYNLFDLIQHPYDEGTTEQITNYYRRAPDEALISGGTAFMSCSS